MRLRGEPDAFGRLDEPVTRRELLRVTGFIEIALTVFVVILLALGGWSLWLQVQHGSEVSAIQHQREATIRESCLEQNHRNAVLSTFLNGLPSVRHAPASQKVVLAQFVQALAPHEDCRAVLHRRTTGDPP